MSAAKSRGRRALEAAARASRRLPAEANARPGSEWAEIAPQRGRGECVSAAASATRSFLLINLALGAKRWRRRLLGLRQARKQLQEEKAEEIFWPSFSPRLAGRPAGWLAGWLTGRASVFGRPVGRLRARDKDKKPD